MFNSSVGSFCVLVPVQTWISGLLGRCSRPQNSGHLLHMAKLGQSPYVDLRLREDSPEDNLENLSSGAALNQPVWEVLSSHSLTGDFGKLASSYRHHKLDA